MLAVDPALRAELNELDGAISSFDDGMARLDTAPVQGEAAAVMRIGSAMRQRLAERSAMSIAKPAQIAGARRVPAWAYPAAAAAAVLLVCLLWYERPAGSDPRIVANPTQPHTIDASPPAVAEKITDDMTKSFGQGNPTQAPKSVASLEAAEEQIAELTNGGSDPVRSFFAIPDSNE
jgi:hypothetical protein